MAQERSAAMRRALSIPVLGAIWQFSDYFNKFLDGFFMTGWQEASEVEQRDGCVYLGLSGVHPSRRGKGIGARLYRRFLLDSESWVARTEVSVLSWPVVHGAVLP